MIRFFLSSALIGQLPGLIFEQPLHIDEEESEAMIATSIVSNDNDVPSRPTLSFSESLVSPSKDNDSLEDKLFQMPPGTVYSFLAPMLSMCLPFVVTDCVVIVATDCVVVVVFVYPSVPCYESSSR